MLNLSAKVQQKNDIPKFLGLEMSKICGLLVFAVVLAILDRYANLDILVIPDGTILLPVR